jgi:hypothetical protein
LPCDPRPAVASTVRIVHKSQPADYTLFACPPALKSENYEEIFFYAIGLSPVILTAFSFENLKPLAHDNVILQEIISLLGGTYASQNPHLLTMSQSDKIHLLNDGVSLRTHLQTQIDGFTLNEQSNVILICGLLLSLSDVFSFLKPGVDIELTDCFLL